MQNQNMALDVWDMLTLLSLVLQIKVYDETRKESNNDDILDELRSSIKVLSNKQDAIMSMLNDIRYRL